MQSDRVQRILKASREQFSKYGYSGARIDIISENSHTNKRLVYEYCHTKEGLYLAVLSDVSREVMACLESGDRLHRCESIEEIYAVLVEILSPYREFIRLWAWERLSPTIHGPRILETVDAIFDRVCAYSKDFLASRNEPPMDDAVYSSLKIVCTGYLIANAVMVSEEETSEFSETISERPVSISDEAASHLQRVMRRGIGLAVGKI